MKLRSLIVLFLAFFMFPPEVVEANPRTGMPTNLHRRFVVKRTKERASRGLSTKRNVGVWLSGGYERTVRSARRGRR